MTAINVIGSRMGHLPARPHHVHHHWTWNEPPTPNTIRTPLASLTTFPLARPFLDGVGFNTVELYGKLQRIHGVICQSWHNQIHNIFVPQKENISKSTAFSTKLLLDQFNAPSVVQWYKQLTGICKAYHIGLVPFDAIQFTRQHKDLCIPGLGTDWYTNMANALCTVMSICLESADSRLKAMVSSMEAKSHNGYVIVWKLLCRYVPGFDLAKSIDKPHWEDYNCNVIHYAVGFDLYFRLCTKRKNYHSQYHRLILFLQGIMAPHLMKVVKLLLMVVESQQPDKNETMSWIGYLPPHLCIDDLAQKLAKRSKVDPYDCDLGGRPQINYTGHGNPTHIALTTSDDNNDGSTPPNTKPIHGHMQGCTISMVKQAHCPSGLPGRCMLNTTYAQKPNITWCMREDQPRMTCKACSKTSNGTNNCNLLAMLVFLQRYLKNGIATKSTIKAAEKRRIEQWEDQGGSLTTMPRKIYQAYTDLSGLTLDQMEDKINWLCWPDSYNIPLLRQDQLIQLTINQLSDCWDTTANDDTSFQRYPTFDIILDSNVKVTTKVMKLTHGKLMKQQSWSEWNKSEFLVWHPGCYHRQISNLLPGVDLCHKRAWQTQKGLLCTQ
jgi:hypothetical protein